MTTNSAQLSLIFIPDISGFTKFVNETEIQHSQHIIQELLEILIDSNQIGLSVSEIEGDAILFYIKGKIPDIAELSQQIKKMFINFHQHLKIIERDRVCHCGACSTATNLTLKFMTHAGEITESNIKTHKKLMGKDVIIAHRLLKNNIDSDEYSLITEDYLSNYNNQDFNSFFDWADFQNGIMQYDHIGDVKFKYINLEPLKKLISVPAKNESFIKNEKPLIHKIFIRSPKEEVYRVLIDLELRKNWTYGILNIDYLKNEIPKIGTMHKCDFEKGSFDIEMIYAKEKKDSLEFAERTKDNILFPQATTLFKMEDEDNGTAFFVEFHYKKIPIISKIIERLFLPKFNENINKSIVLLKDYCENNPR